MMSSQIHREVLVYAPWCHWVWGGGWLAQWGVWDFAGGIVVHVTAGFSALASLIVVGKREVPLDQLEAGSMGAEAWEGGIIGY